MKVNADKAQLEQVFINLFKNAQEAMQAVTCANDTDKVITVFCKTE